MKKTKGQENGEQKVSYIEGDPYSAITKREYFAGLAMQGYIVQRHAQDDMDRNKLAEWSVKMADELLEALSKPKN